MIFLPVRTRLADWTLLGLALAVRFAGLTWKAAAPEMSAIGVFARGCSGLVWLGGLVPPAGWVASKSSDWLGWGVSPVLSSQQGCLPVWLSSSHSSVLATQGRWRNRVSLSQWATLTQLRVDRALSQAARTSLLRAWPTSVQRLKGFVCNSCLFCCTR
jgi:hypothetical protein